MVVGLFSGGTSLNSGAAPLNFRLLAAPDRRKLSSSPSNFPNRKTSPLSSHHSGFSGTRKAIKMILIFDGCWEHVYASSGTGIVSKEVAGHQDDSQPRVSISISFSPVPLMQP